MKDVLRKRCVYCECQFEPDPCARVQKCCGDRKCRRARKRQNLRHWRSLQPQLDQRYAAKERAWAKAYPNYWQRYRATHPDYTERDNRRRAVAMKAARRSANETGLRGIVVEKLQVLDALDKPVCSANETGLLRRVGAIEDCLRSTVAMVCSAK